MKTNETTQLFRERIQQLLDQLSHQNSDSTISPRSVVDGCFIGTVGVAESLYGAQSIQVKAIMELKKAGDRRKPSYSTFTMELLAESLEGILLNIREELDSGLIRNLEVEASGEVIGDLVALARSEVKSGYFHVAAVLASAGLEDALKMIAQRAGINVTGKSLDTVINALKSKSFFKGPQVSVITSYIKLRNAAMHADWSAIKEAEVNSLIAFLESFLLEHFK